jgi:hypothetical protein
MPFAKPPVVDLLHSEGLPHFVPTRENQGAKPLLPAHIRAELVHGQEAIGQLNQTELVAGTTNQFLAYLALQLTDDPLGCSCKAARIHKRGASSVAPAETERERRERAWRRAKGGDDLLDLALNYEHVLLIARLCGPFPRAMVKSARYRSSYFENDGDLRFRPRVGPVSLRDRLRRCTPLRNAPLDLATDFLTQLLSLDSNVRPTAAAALAHPWLAGIKYS